MQRFTFCLTLFFGVALRAACAEEKPVILLTGFEPFGGRKQNVSWEGARRLDGAEWRGHRIVAKELPVEWGAPPELLSKWIEELQPVAVFSFGQGGGYALETRARNLRGKASDNRQQMPPHRETVEGGPESFAATIDAERLVAALAERNYRVKISGDAGNYLCEECLYSLEHLRSTKQLKMDVLFCHLPPLEEGKYSALDAETFMRAMLESWKQHR
jgi:pyroglutamyl-peptidase